MNPTIRTGVSPLSEYPRYKKQLEDNGYVIIREVEGDGEAEDTILFEYERVNHIARKRFMPSQDGWQ
jgi:hypothetical protein